MIVYYLKIFSTISIVIFGLSDNKSNDQCLSLLDLIKSNCIFLLEDNPL